MANTLSTGGLYSDQTIQWFLDDVCGPLGRMSQIILNQPRMVVETVVNDDGEDEQRDVEDSPYSRRCCVVMFDKGKRVAKLNNLEQYDARRIAETWIEQGE